MSCFSKVYLQSSIGKKQIMAITGLMLSGFTLTHLMGNFLLIDGAEVFNNYGHKLMTNPLIYIAEAGLVVLFLVHMGLAIKLTIENNSARPEKYFMKTRTGKGATLPSSTMIFTGMIILFFIVSHLIHFKFGAYYEAEYAGVRMRDLYKLVMESFQNPMYVAWYVICMFALAMHLNHGIQSTFQSLGINHPKYTPFIQKAGIIMSISIGLGYSAIPIWAFIKGVR